MCEFNDNNAALSHSLPFYKQLHLNKNQAQTAVKHFADFLQKVIISLSKYVSVSKYVCLSM